MVLALLFPAAVAAQLSSIGLSEVRGQWFLHPNFSSGDRFGEALATGDFNGDGANDLATGVPRDDGPVFFTDVGSVIVRYGVPGGGFGFSTQELREVGDDVGSSELFGAALAAADFNGDGFDDLAVGIPRNDTTTRRGAVRVYFGGGDGLILGGAAVQFIEEATAGEPWHAVCGYTEFGYALAAGDFDGDPWADLAIGAPSACERVDANTTVRGGAVFVAHGRPGGLLPWYGYRISQDSPGLYEQAEADDRFGAALAAGDFDGDGFDDLAIGVPGESDDDAGAVQSLMGSSFGLIFADSVFWYPEALGEVPEPGDGLGTALAAGDFDGDGRDDLAIGIPLEDLGVDGVHEDAGQVDVVYGAADPIWFDLSRTDHLAQGAIYGNESQDGSGDEFGWALATGNFDGDGRDDLAIGHPGDDWSGFNSGNVTVLMGTSANIGGSTRFRLLGIGWEGLPGPASQGGLAAGRSVASGDFDGDGFADLAIGVPGFALSVFFPDDGAEAILHGSAFADGFECGSADRW